MHRVYYNYYNVRNILKENYKSIQIYVVLYSSRYKVERIAHSWEIQGEYCTISTDRSCHASQGVVN